MTTTPTQPRGTCQICARSIGIKSAGRIAHHGYTRPGYGWQTSSCYGARHLPYEQSRDAIPAAIEGARRYIAGAQKIVTEMLAEPPAVINVAWEDSARSLRGYSRSEPRYVLARPEGFDPTLPSPGSYQRGGRDHYACAFHNRLSELRFRIAAARQDEAHWQARYDAWVAPTAEEAA